MNHPKEVTPSSPVRLGRQSGRLADLAPELQRILTRGRAEPVTPPLFAESEIRRRTVMVPMRDGVRLATDLYLPPKLPAPAIAARTPYGRAANQAGLSDALLVLARHGYVVISQDCRGTGDSEPDHWDMYIYEPEDSVDFVEWVSRQDWFDGFLGSLGGSYVGSTQWDMAMHPRMSAIAPEVAALNLEPSNTPRFHMFANAYARSVGKGEDKVPVPFEELERQMLEETLATGHFNEPLHKPFPETLLTRFPELGALPPSLAKRRLFEHYRALPPAGRAELIRFARGKKIVDYVDLKSLASVFGHQVPYGLCLVPAAGPSELARSLHAPALLITAWYDWGLYQTLKTWELLRREAREPVRSQSRLFIAPSAHNMPGYHEGEADHPELRRNHRTANNIDLLLRWYEAVRGDRTGSWPTVIYYLTGANEWRIASDWPVPEAKETAFYLADGGVLALEAPRLPSSPDCYTYDPNDPTPTVGGSIVSYVYPPGSVDVSETQKRPDVLTYTTAPLEQDLDVVGPLHLVLHASSSAVDTDFAARLSDVFPDGRAIQLQNGVLRARYRNLTGEAELLEPGRVYRFEIIVGATAHRFRVGHRLRVDISSSDFPKFDRNTNRGGEPGEPIPALQNVYHDPDYPSHLVVSVLADRGEDA